MVKGMKRGRIQREKEMAKDKKKKEKEGGKEEKEKDRKQEEVAFLSARNAQNTFAESEENAQIRNESTESILT